MSGNGRLLPSERVTVQGSIQLARGTAAAWTRLADAFHRENPDLALRIAQPLGGYRSFDMQAAIKAHPERYGVTVPSSMIAAPGASPHGFGNCVDVAGAINSGRIKSWMLANGPKFGWSRPIAGDENHWRFDGTTGASSGETPIDEEEPLKLDAEDQNWIRLAIRDELRLLLEGKTNPLTATNPVDGKQFTASVGQFLTGTFTSVQVVAQKVEAAPVGGVDAADVERAAQAGAAAALKNLTIPTAEQNGIAARNAIVK